MALVAFEELQVTQVISGILASPSINILKSSNYYTFHAMKVDSFIRLYNDIERILK
jgi:hypothetical protein